MRYIQKYISYKDKDVAVVVGYTQPGDMIVDGGIFVKQAFNGTTPVIDLGFKADNQGGTVDPNALASALVPTTVGAIKADELAAATNKPCTSTDAVTATFSVASGTPSTGKAYVWFAILNDSVLNEK